MTELMEPKRLHPSGFSVPSAGWTPQKAAASVMEPIKLKGLHPSGCSIPSVGWPQPKAAVSEMELMEPKRMPSLGLYHTFGELDPTKSSGFSDGADGA